MVSDWIFRTSELGLPEVIVLANSPGNDPADAGSILSRFEYPRPPTRSTHHPITRWGRRSRPLSGGASDIPGGVDSERVGTLEGSLCPLANERGLLKDQAASAESFLSRHNRRTRRVQDKSILVDFDSRGRIDGQCEAKIFVEPSAKIIEPAEAGTKLWA
jgi:hypothetical protein